MLDLHTEKINMFYKIGEEQSSLSRSKGCGSGGTSVFVTCRGGREKSVRNREGGPERGENRDR